MARKKLGFLEQHYILCRKNGENHASYVILNDLSDEIGEHLRKMYENPGNESPRKKK